MALMIKFTSETGDIWNVPNEKIIAVVMREENSLAPAFVLIGREEVFVADEVAVQIIEFLSNA